MNALLEHASINFFNLCAWYCMCACVHMWGAWVRACMNAWLRACMNAWLRACMDAWVRACMHACVYIVRACVRARVHAHVCTNISILMVSGVGQKKDESKDRGVVTQIV